ncbi:MAG: DUF547 domain-containing protein, partial [Bacteroidota bacterium]
QVLKIALILLIALLFLGLGYAVLAQKNGNELALAIFSQIKTWSGKKVDWRALDHSPRPVPSHAIWDQLLRTYVQKDGRVNYRDWQQQQRELQIYLQQLSSNPPGRNWTEQEQLAYWINAYNAFTIQLILDHYPLPSIKTIAGNWPMINSPWDLRFFQIGGIDFDLNTIEHDILREQFAEPRIHFAINCASIACPILRNEAYMAAQLEAQLEDQTRNFINDPERNQLDTDQLELSMIFSWFASDFTQGQHLHDFLKMYTTVPLSTEAAIQFREYDWQLNEHNQ